MADLVPRALDTAREGPCQLQPDWIALVTIDESFPVTSGTGLQGPELPLVGLFAEQGPKVGHLEDGNNDKQDRLACAVYQQGERAVTVGQ